MLRHHSPAITPAVTFTIPTPAIGISLMPCPPIAGLIHHLKIDNAYYETKARPFVPPSPHFGGKIENNCRIEGIGCGGAESQRIFSGRFLHLSMFHRQVHLQLSTVDTFYVLGVVEWISVISCVWIPWAIFEVSTVVICW
ncbi:hypothetical protein DFH07DRAFT_55840 [Mycena maculata]|uniref:Uncharacterized protein n=1 Tax=Mycena maculata TaxID=230809 RepID=A0AAD7N1E8_9AGAR|nr:hypothetical protein DFH07DRAFT_55840 [Mycena maculata]